MKDYRLPPAPSLSLRNFHARSGEIEGMLFGRLTTESLSLFVEWLLNRVVLVGVRALGRGHGYRIFESMNDRGARLTSVDLAKVAEIQAGRADGGEQDARGCRRRMPHACNRDHNVSEGRGTPASGTQVIE